MDVSLSSTLVVRESIVWRVSLWIKWTGSVPLKSALFQFAQYILMNPLACVRSSKGRDRLLFEKWSWWTCCQCCKNRPKGIRPPLRKTLIWEDLSPTSWQVDRQMALLASNLSNYRPTFFLSYSSAWVPTTKHSSIQPHSSANAPVINLHHRALSDWSDQKTFWMRF